MERAVRAGNNNEAGIQEVNHFATVSCIRTENEYNVRLGRGNDGNLDPGGANVEAGTIGNTTEQASK